MRLATVRNRCIEHDTSRRPHRPAICRVDTELAFPVVIGAEDITPRFSIPARESIVWHCTVRFRIVPLDDGGQCGLVEMPPTDRAVDILVRTSERSARPHAARVLRVPEQKKAEKYSMKLRLVR